MQLVHPDKSICRCLICYAQIPLHGPVEYVMGLCSGNPYLPTFTNVLRSMFK